MKLFLSIRTWNKTDKPVTRSNRAVFKDKSLGQYPILKIQIKIEMNSANQSQCNSSMKFKSKRKNRKLRPRRQARQRTSSNSLLLHNTRIPFPTTKQIQMSKTPSRLVLWTQTCWDNSMTEHQMLKTSFKTKMTSRWSLASVKHKPYWLHNLEMSISQSNNRHILWMTSKKSIKEERQRIRASSVRQVKVNEVNEVKEAKPERLSSTQLVKIMKTRLTNKYHPTTASWQALRISNSHGRVRDRRSQVQSNLSRNRMAFRCPSINRKRKVRLRVKLRSIPLRKTNQNITQTINTRQTRMHKELRLQAVSTSVQWTLQ